MYYRIVDETVEPAGIILDSREQSAGSARKKRTAELYGLFEYICSFASKQQMKIISAVNIAVNPEVYIPNLKNAYKSEIETVSFADIGCFMPGEISIKELLNYMMGYQKLCSETGTWIHSEGSDQSLIKEYFFEAIKRKYAPDMPSRLNSIALFDDEEKAEKYREDYYGESGIVVPVELKDKRAFGKFDMTWFTDVPSDATYSSARAYAENYWKHRESAEDAWEYLFDGNYIIIS